MPDDENARPYSMKPRFLGQPLWWWLGGNGPKDEVWERLFGRPMKKHKLWERPGLIVRRAMGVRPRPIVCAKEIYDRGRHGYTTTDTWSLDGYILSWLPSAIAELRENNHGHPANICDHPHDGSDNGHACDGAEKWESILTQIEKGLLAGRKLGGHDYYESGVTPWEEVRQIEDDLNAEFLEGWMLMGKWFHHLWD